MAGSIVSIELWLSQLIYLFHSYDHQLNIYSRGYPYKLYSPMRHAIDKILI